MSLLIGSLLRYLLIGSCKVTTNRFTVTLNIPFAVNPPVVPSENPTGCYRTTFNVTKDELKQRNHIVFEGVNSAFHLWCNGEYVGYSQDSRLPAEFDLSGYLVEGENRLAVMVIRWSDGSYLEDQDMWWLSGNLPRRKSSHQTSASHSGRVCYAKP